MRGTRRIHVTRMGCITAAQAGHAVFAAGPQASGGRQGAIRLFPTVDARRREPAARRRCLSLACGLALLLPAAGLAQTRTLHLDAARSRVVYRIEATVAAVTGSAGTPAGDVVVDGDTTKPRLAGRVAIDLRQLQTGISQRDHHIKSDEYLDVERYPVSEFVLDSLSTLLPSPASPQERGERLGGEPSGPPPSWTGTACGRLTLHGSGHDQQVPVALWWLGRGSGLEVRGDLVIELADHGIKRPKKFILRAGKSVRVHLDLVFRP